MEKKREGALGGKTGPHETISADLCQGKGGLDLQGNGSHFYTEFGAVSQCMSWGSYAYHISSSIKFHRVTPKNVFGHLDVMWYMCGWGGQRHVGTGGGAGVILSPTPQLPLGAGARGTGIPAETERHTQRRRELHAWSRPRGAAERRTAACSNKETACRARRSRPSDTQRHTCYGAHVNMLANTGWHAHCIVCSVMQ